MKLRMQRTPFRRVLPGAGISRNERGAKLPCGRPSVSPRLIDSRTHKILDVFQQCQEWTSRTQLALQALNIRVTPKIVREVMEFEPNTAMAMAFFKWVPQQNNYQHSPETYAAFIRHLGRSHKLEPIYTALKDMHQEGCAVTPYLLAEIMMIFGRQHLVPQACKVFDDVMSLGCRPNLFVCNCLISILTRAGFLEKAQSLYRKMWKMAGCRPDTVTFNMLIDSSGKLGNLPEALCYFQDMKHNGVQPNVKTYTSLIGCFCRAQKLEEACKLFDDIKGNRKLVNTVTMTELIKGLGKAGDIGNAIKILRDAEAGGIWPDQVTYNILIDCLGKAGRMEEAVTFFNEMEVNGFIGSIVTFNSLISGFGRAGMVNEACSTYERMLNKDIAPSAYTIAILIGCLCKADVPNAVYEFFQKMQQIFSSYDQALSLSGFKDCRYEANSTLQNKDRKEGDQREFCAPSFSDSHCKDSWDGGKSTSIEKDLNKGYEKDPYIAVVCRLIERMDQSSFKCNALHNVLLDGLVKAGKLDMAYTHFKAMFKIGCHPDIVSHNILIHGFGDARKTDKALEFFLNAKKLNLKLDLVLYNTVIDALGKAGRIEEIREVIDEMNSKGLRPDVVTYTSVFNAVKIM